MYSQVLLLATISAYNITSPRPARRRAAASRRCGGGRSAGVYNRTAHPAAPQRTPHARNASTHVRDSCPPIGATAPLEPLASIAHLPSPTCPPTPLLSLVRPPPRPPAPRRPAPLSTPIVEARARQIPGRRTPRQYYSSHSDSSPTPRDITLYHCLLYRSISIPIPIPIAIHSNPIRSSRQTTRIPRWVLIRDDQAQMHWGGDHT